MLGVDIRLVWIVERLFWFLGLGQTLWFRMGAGMEVLANYGAMGKRAGLRFVVGECIIFKYSVGNGKLPHI